MNRLLLCVLAYVLTACTTSGESPSEAIRNTAPPDTITPYASTAQPVPPAQVAATNKAIATAALPTSIPGFTPAPPPTATLLLCPPLAKPVPRDLVQAFNVWQGTGRTLAVTVINDPAKAPADSMIATLQPPDCPTSVNGMQYIYDRQPQDRSDGWTGTLNTILTTNTRTGARSYDAAYLMSKDSVLVNVVASRTDRSTFDPSIDELAAMTLEKVLSQLAV